MLPRILIVHGIANQFVGEMELRTAWYPALCDGLLRAGETSLPTQDDCFCPFYGDLFRPGDRLSGQGATVEAVDELTPDEAQLLETVWRAAAATDPRVPSPAEFGDTLFRAPRVVERAVTALARSAFLADTIPLQFLGDLKQVAAYVNDPVVRDRVLERVIARITPDTKLVVGHSLGSVVAYEALCAKPEQVVAFLSVGSPLGIRNVVFDKLTPKPSNSRGSWPGQVTWWTNIAARGDIVAAQKALAPLFGDRVDDVLIDSGWDAHSSTRYLNTKEAGLTAARALSA